MPIRADYVEDLALQQLETALRLAEIWKRRISKRHAHGIHGILFYELEAKKPVYPTRRDGEAVSPDGSLARWGLMPAAYAFNGRAGTRLVLLRIGTGGR